MFKNNPKSPIGAGIRNNQFHWETKRYENNFLWSVHWIGASQELFSYHGKYKFADHFAKEMGAHLVAVASKGDGTNQSLSGEKRYYFPKKSRAVLHFMLCAHFLIGFKNNLYRDHFQSRLERRSLPQKRLPGMSAEHTSKIWRLECDDRKGPGRSYEIYLVLKICKVTQIKEWFIATTSANIGGFKDKLTWFQLNVNGDFAVI